MATSTAADSGSLENKIIKTLSKKNDEISLLELKFVCSEVKMWSQSVVDFSSQYGNELSISYTMSNLEGKSNIYTQYGDFTQAAVMRTYGQWWMRCPSAIKDLKRSRGSFISQDFVEISFEMEVLPTNIEVFETYNPGAVVRILACDACHVDKLKRYPSLRWFVLWEGQPQTPPQAARIFNPHPIRKCPFYTNLVRIEFNQSHLPYYTELDAVRLTGLLPPTNPTENQPITSQQNCHNQSIGSSSLMTFCNKVLGLGHNREQKSVRELSNNGNDDDDDNNTGTSVDGPPIITSPPSSSSAPSSSSSSAAAPYIINHQDHLENSDDEDDDFEDDTGAFFRLPVEILSIIFNYLDLNSLCRFSLTCRFFYKHCHDETQYYGLDLQPYWHMVTDRMLTSISERCSKTRQINLSWCSCLTDSGFYSFFTECKPLLTCLRLNCCPFVDCGSIMVISSQCPNLKELRLQSCQKASGSSFSYLGNLRELKIVDLYRTLVNSDSLVKIIRSCQKLEQVNFGSCTNNTDCDRVACELARSCPNLRTVDFWRSRGLSRVGLSALVRGCPLIEGLDLGWCNQLKSNEGCFKEITQNCLNLKKLFVTANRSLCDSDLDLLSQNCCHLQQLDILGTREITNISILRLLDRCQELELLDLSFCAGIDYPTLEPALLAHPRVDVKCSFQGSSQAEEYLDRPAQLQ